MTSVSGEIIERIFERAREDPSAALLASAFAMAYDGRSWNAKELSRRLDAAVAARVAQEGERS